MKNRTIYITAAITILIPLISLMFTGCTKDADKKTVTDNQSSDTTGYAGFKETNEDLVSVDYSYFYNQLSAKGEWVQMSSKDLGLTIKPGISGHKGSRSMLDDLLGINYAYAQTDADIFYLFVWRPSIELAADMISDKNAGAYVPYNNGQWIYTDGGWYFKANTPEEDLTCHYGRWTLDPKLGWVWLPGKVWAPAWVEMREDENYVAWAPVPPGAYIDRGVINQTVINENRYTIVEKKQFIEPSVYKYRYQYVENKNKIMIKEMTKTDGVMIKNKTVINKGPEPGGIEKFTGKKINTVKIVKVGKFEDAGNTGDAINYFTPEFRKVTIVKNEPVSKPDKIVSYQDAKSITKEQQDVLKENDKDQKREDKEIKLDDKSKEKEMKSEEKDYRKDVKQREKEWKDEEKGNKKEQKDEDKERRKEEKEHGNKKDDDNGNKEKHGKDKK